MNIHGVDHFSSKINLSLQVWLIHPMSQYFLCRPERRGITAPRFPVWSLGESSMLSASASADSPSLSAAALRSLAPPASVERRSSPPRLVWRVPAGEPGPSSRPRGALCPLPFAPSAAPFLCTECCSRFAFLGVSRSPFVDFIYYFICILSFVLRVWQQMCFFLGTGWFFPLICSIGCPLSWLGSRSPLASHVLVVGCTWVSFLSSDARPMGSKWFRCNVLLELLSASL